MNQLTSRVPKEIPVSINKKDFNILVDTIAVLYSTQNIYSPTNITPTDNLTYNYFAPALYKGLSSLCDILFFIVLYNKVKIDFRFF